MDKWKNKVAVVTGASSGIGAAVAVKLVENGMIVVGVARRLDRLQELKSKMSHSDRFHPFKCDVGKEQDIVDMFRNVDEKLGRVDVLINNAAVAHMTSLIDPSADVLEAIFRINCIGPCLCTREALKIMKKHNIESGYIMFTNGLAGHRILPASPGQVLHVYPCSAAKYALRAIADGLRQELRAQGSKIRVGQVSPGAVETEIASSFDKAAQASGKSLDAEATKQMLDKTFESLQALNIIQMKPEDIADAFVYMLSAPERADVNEIIINHMGSQF